MAEEIEITYDKFGRMNYHPDFHFAQDKPFSESNLEYICKFYEVDDARTISFAIGKTEQTIRAKVTELKENGLYEYYKNRNKYW
ncbi:DNA-entry nuclease [Lysinibacillus piscis]|uniref:DNA-entry nuclease n=1 Tax=Lysinibacillus piscis TaxID=2518931 RepID=A0ABQ5NIM5_9BACI|nr:DNA-entry nuclease [Lysinibacillus sp. KH24]GLC88230.1 hypothetical protein LYSBPC_13570 [Lysinibacillus sp. KH24]